MSPTPGGSISLGLDTSEAGTTLYHKLSGNVSQYIATARSANDRYNTDNHGNHTAAYTQVNEKINAVQQQFEELFGTNAQQQTINRTSFEGSSDEASSLFTQLI